MFFKKTKVSISKKTKQIKANKTLHNEHHNEINGKKKQ